MSLKAFHIIFVTIATLAMVGFGVWGVNQPSTGYQLMGGLGFFAAVALMVYGAWFMRKMKNVSYL